MKKRPSPHPLGRNEETEFSSPLTPEVTGGRRSRPHRDRFRSDPDLPGRDRVDDTPHLGRKGGAT